MMSCDKRTGRASGPVHSCFQGGIKAVLWVDTFQSAVMLVGVIALIAMGVAKSGGLTDVWTVAAAHGRINFGE